MDRLSRRQFILRASGVAAIAGLAQGACAKGAPVSNIEARWYKTLSKKMVKCGLCPRHCTVSDKGRGYCGVRENRGGTYTTLVYGVPCAIHVDPIEKKPLHHAVPGSLAYSIATAGCNMECDYCQNWEISQALPEDTYNYKLPPKEVVSEAQKAGCKWIAFTYTEPVVFAEYVYDTAKLAKAAGVKTVMISNGFIDEGPMRELCSQLTAVKIDLKGFNEGFYQKNCDGELKPVLHTLKVLKSTGVWFEIVNLVVPTLNDDMGEIKAMSKWLLGNLGANVPIAFTRFTPMYKLLNLPPTPVETLEKARRIALDVGINYVYVGNVPGHTGENTYCHACGKLLIQRIGYDVRQNRVKNGCCSFCGAKIPGIWQ
jgi:pyruvate formate lyase activating enzyme